MILNILIIGKSIFISILENKMKCIIVKTFFKCIFILNLLLKENLTIL